MSNAARDAIISGAILVGAVVVRLVIGAVLRRRHDEDGNRRFWMGRLASSLVAVAAAIALIVIWAPLGGRSATIVGFFAAGVAFAMQEVIGALFGWLNILMGHVFRIGDRIEMGGIRGDVIDLTPLRTRIMEIGQPGDIGSDSGDASPSSWVHGRQYTGRIVAVSNKSVFTDPVYNYSTVFDYIWEELIFPVPYRCDWRAADRILLAEAERVSASHEAHEAIREIARRYPVPVTEVQPHVFARATSNWVELAVRFAIPVRTARTIKDEMTRRILDQFDAAGIEVASTTSDVTLFRADGASAPRFTEQ